MINFTSLIPSLTGLSFGQSWILAGLLALPVLWYILRITPPSARIITLPTVRFLKDLIPRDQVPSQTPLIIFLLRLMIAALTIIGLSAPSLNQTSYITDDTDIQIVIDNSWPAAASWTQQMNTARDIIAEAGKKNRAVNIITTAPQPNEEQSLYQGPLTAPQAQAVVDTIKPLPWPADYKAIEKQLNQKTTQQPLDTFWLSHGIDEGSISGAIQTLESYGRVSVFSPAAQERPLLLNEEQSSHLPGFEMKVLSVDNLANRPSLNLQAFDTNGRLVDQSNNKNKKDSFDIFSFSTPASQRNQISHVKIQGPSGAGSTYIFDTRYQKKLVGLISASEDAKPKPFIESRYYITRAIEPFAKIITGSVADLIDKNPSVMILNDNITLSSDNLNTIEKWIRKGGLLIRFAGPDLAQAGAQSSARSLLPVDTRSGERALGGQVTWDTPRILNDFSKNSPLFGIDPSEDILVTQQILAEPDPELEKKTWARLNDQTPLITASALGSGLIVFIHTAATPDWSGLVLSGVFVEIMQRLINLGGQTQAALSDPQSDFRAVRVMDGFGNMQEPDKNIRPISYGDLADIRPSSFNPPGLYESKGQYFALNIARHIPLLTGVEESLQGRSIQNYGNIFTLDLMPYFLCMALCLLILDWIIVIVMAGGFRRLKPLAFILACIISTNALPAYAKDGTLDYANNLYLAYIKTGDVAVDSLSERGLQNLSIVTRNRTSVEPEGVIGLDPENDTLVFFPIIYWPVSNDQTDLSRAAVQKIQHYLDHGGTIIFDTRDGMTATQNMFDGSVNATRLRDLLEPLTIPALEPLPANHVLMRSFYILKFTPGRLQDGGLWVETKSTPGRDGVSSIIIGSYDWAGAWSEVQPDEYGDTINPQQEQAFRFGVNVLMYALTGNYKEDQVHVQNILKKIQP
jgi:hypothetical protein